MMANVAVFWRAAPWTLGRVGTEIVRHPDPAAQSRRERRDRGLLAVGLGSAAVLAALVWAGVVSPDVQAIGRLATYVLVGAGAVWIMWMYAARRVRVEDWRRVPVVAFVCILGALYWSAFELAPTALNQFAGDFTDHVVGGFQIPVTWFQSFNTIAVILLAPVFALFWSRLARRGREPSSAAKLPLGFTFSAAGFLLMMFAADQVVAGRGVFQAPAWWLIASYTLQSAGELCLSPVGLSMVSRLAPRGYAGQSMAIWFLATAAGSLLAGILWPAVDPEKLDAMSSLFLDSAGVLALGAVLSLIPFVLLQRRTSSRGGDSVLHRSAR
jgi:POT family proton-dependent oligopeptide transporter